MFFSRNDCVRCEKALSYIVETVTRDVKIKTFTLPHSVPVPSHDLQIYNIILSWSYVYVHWVDVRGGCSLWFVDIDGCVYHHYLNFLFIMHGLHPDKLFPITECWNSPEHSVTYYISLKQLTLNSIPSVSYKIE